MAAKMIYIYTHIYIHIYFSCRNHHIHGHHALPTILIYSSLFLTFSIFSYRPARWSITLMIYIGHLFLQERCKSYQIKNYTLDQVKEILTSSQQYSLNLVHEDVLLSSLCMYQSHIYIHLNYLLIPITLVQTSQVSRGMYCCMPDLCFGFTIRSSIATFADGW